MKRTTLLSAPILLLALVFACELGVGTDPVDVENYGDSTTLPTEPSDPSKGLMHIALQPISPKLTESLNTAPSGDLNSKVLLFASSVEFTLEYPEGSGIPDDVWTEAVPYYPPGDDMPQYPIASHEVEPGDGLVLSAKVFNSTVSASDPVIVGTSAPFDVNAGLTTSVTIMGLPYNPTLLPYDTDTTGSLAQVPYSITTNDNGTPGDTSDEDEGRVIQDSGGEVKNRPVSRTWSRCRSSSSSTPIWPGS